MATGCLSFLTRISLLAAAVWLLLMPAANGAGEATFALPPAPEVTVTHHVGVVALEPLAQHIGATYTWDTLTNVLTVTRDGKSYTCIPAFPPNPFTRDVTVEVRTFALAGAVYVPILECVQALGGSVAINTETSTATVRLPGLATPLKLPINYPKSNMLDPFIDIDYELYSLPIAGGAPRRLTYDSPGNNLPIYSPDGKQCVYSHSDSLMLRDIATQRDTILLKGDPNVGLCFRAERYTSDGRAVIAYGFNRDKKKSGALRVNVDGSGVTTLAPQSFLTDVSADGKKITYYSTEGVGEDAVSALYVAKADGSDAQLIDAQGGGPAQFSADGRLLLWRKNDREHQRRFICVQVLEGEQAGTVFQPAPGIETLLESDPAFSPDGAWIVFAKEHGLWIMRYDRTEMRELTNTVGEARPPMMRDRTPAFTPDGRHILFSRRNPRTRANDLHIIKPDGSGLRALTNGLDVVAGSFSPDLKEFFLLAHALDGAQLADSATPVRQPLPTVLIHQQVGVIPLEAIAVALGAEVTKMDDGTMTLALNNRTFTCTPGFSGAKSTFKRTEFTPEELRHVELPLAPFTRYGMTWAPTTQVITALGGMAHVSQGSKSVIINMRGPQANSTPLVLPYADMPQ